MDYRRKNGSNKTDKIKKKIFFIKDIILIDTNRMFIVEYQIIDSNLVSRMCEES